MKAIILAFLLQLDTLSAADPHMADLHVLAAVNQPIQEALVQGRADVTVPEHFGLSTPAADAKLHAAVETFIHDARADREFAAAKTPDARIELLYNDGNLSPQGHAYDDYFAFAGTN